MLCRVAENLFWIARYVERAGNLARLLDDAFHLGLDVGLGEGDPVGPLESILTLHHCRESFLARSGDPTSREAILDYLTFERSGGHSVLAMIGIARENARGSQEMLAEAWSQLNRLYLFLSSSKARLRLRESPFQFYDRIRRECTLFDGLVDGVLPHDEGFHFLHVGRFLERVNMLSRILNARFHDRPALVAVAADSAEADRPVRWTSLLRSCSAYDAYLKHHQDHVEPIAVVRYLLLEESFPRSMRYSVARCLESLRALAGGGTTSAERQLGRLDSELRYMDLDEVFARGLSKFLAGVQESCNAVGVEVQKTFFLT